jgi:hypothetical protein
MKSFTEFPAGKFKSKITLRSIVSFLETVFNGEILKKRTYRQIPIDRGDLHLVGFQLSDKLFTDRVFPMGLRSSAQICQRITTAVSFIYYKMRSSVSFLETVFNGEILK